MKFKIKFSEGDSQNSLGDGWFVNASVVQTF